MLLNIQDSKKSNRLKKLEAAYKVRNAVTSETNKQYSKALATDDEVNKVVINIDKVYG